MDVSIMTIRKKNTKIKSHLHIYLQQELGRTMSRRRLFSIICYLIRRAFHRILTKLVRYICLFWWWAFCSVLSSVQNLNPNIICSVQNFNPNIIYTYLESVYGFCLDSLICIDELVNGWYDHMYMCIIATDGCKINQKRTWFKQK